jgi:hypothetical protein
VQDTWIAATALVHAVPVYTQDGDFDELAVHVDVDVEDRPRTSARVAPTPAGSAVAADARRSRAGWVLPVRCRARRARRS